MIGQLVGAALGGAISKEQRTDPVKGAAIGMATMFVARRLLPARIAALGAAVAAGYVTRKLAQRAERREAAMKLLPSPDPAPAAPNAPARRQAPAKPAATRKAAAPRKPAKAAPQPDAAPAAPAAPAAATPRPATA